MYEVWYQVRHGEGFAQWTLYEPLPRNAKAAAKAVEKIIASQDWILITVSKVSEAKPHHD